MNPRDRLKGLEKLRDASLRYAQMAQGLIDTIGMGPEQLACMAGEERARVALVAAQQECVMLGILENIP